MSTPSARMMLLVAAAGLLGAACERSLDTPEDGAAPPLDGGPSLAGDLAAPLGPDTRFLQTPRIASNDGDIEFVYRFAGSSTDDTFECSLNRSPWTACTSPFRILHLPEGTNSFQVRAVDARGLVDPVPAGHQVVVGDTPLVRLDFEGDAANRGALGAEFDGRIAGQPEFVPGKQGRGLHFRSSLAGFVEDAVHIATGAMLSDYPRYTLSMWYREDSYLTAVAPSFPTLWDFRRVGPMGGGIDVYHGVDSRDWVACESGVTPEFSACSSPLLRATAEGRWHHLLLTYHGTRTTEGGGPDQLVVVVDGRFNYPQFSDRTNGSVVFNRYQEDTFTIGRYSNLVVDDFRIYNQDVGEEFACTRILGGSYSVPTCTLP